MKQLGILHGQKPTDLGEIFQLNILRRAIQRPASE